jgi:hypothetical protein
MAGQVRSPWMSVSKNWLYVYQVWEALGACVCWGGSSCRAELHP